ncbi:unnamed protein product [Timema podura]|uniref:Uncharacterized protein n=1 Tax=Timema podura TaxID=61482 RepID=A0ABN7NSC7_TIMPD|nr:unnamed protein product [Timema podura]
MTELVVYGWLKYILCWRGLTIFSKISYSVYLTQFLGFFYNVGTTRTSQEFTAFTSVKNKRLPASADAWSDALLSSWIRLLKR